MPDLDNTDAAARNSAESGDAAPSRRSVLRVAAGAGAAGIAATALSGVVAPVAAAAATTGHGARHATPEELATSDAIVVHVRDAAAGEIDVFRGTSEVHVKDRDLAARIVRASR